VLLAAPKVRSIRLDGSQPLESYVKPSIMGLLHRERVRIALLVMLALLINPFYTEKDAEIPSKVQEVERAASLPAPETIARKLVHRKLTDKEINVVRLIWLHFEPAHFTTAVLVANCESTLGLYTTGKRNRNGTQDFGVFQLNNGGTLQSLGGTKALALQTDWNIRTAAKLKERSGWTRWYCYNKIKHGADMKIAKTFTKAILAASDVNIK